MIDEGGDGVANAPWPPDWPYDWSATESRLDPTTIRKQGTFLLCRALNIRRLISFCGSGVSVAYGRVSWTELATRHIKTLRRVVGDFKPSSGGVHDERRDDRDTLLEQLQPFERDRRLGADQNMLALQLCEQIWSLTQDDSELKKLADAFGIVEAYKKVEGQNHPPEHGRELMRAWIKRETFDELAHVVGLLRGARADADARSFPSLFEGCESIKRAWERTFDALDKRASLSRTMAGTEPRPYLALFDLVPVMIDLIKQHISDTLTPAEKNDLCELLELINTKTTGQPVAPTQYYILGFALEIIRLMGGISNAPPMKHSEPPPRAIRREIIPPAQDPLRLLMHTLEIRRHLTTNYDLEFERYFEDYGFKVPSEALGGNKPLNGNERVGPLGGRTRDIVLSENTAAELIDFAVNDQDYALQVFHLHGRSTDDADIIVTEKDYQATYLRVNPQRNALREGLDIALGGNPILFVGLGLNEADVMRPVREFMAGLSRRNRSLIALHPASKAKAVRDNFVMQQYSTHGIHVIHYGHSSEGPAAAVGADADDSWLGRLLDKDNGHLAALRRRLCETAKLEPGDIIHTLTQISASLPKGGKLPFESDGADCDISVDIRAIEHISKLAPTLVKLAGVHKGLKEAKWPHEVAAKEALEVAIERAIQSITTSALCAKLQGVRNEWRRWWDVWKLVPKGRESDAVYGDIPGKKIFYRYLHVGHGSTPEVTANDTEFRLLQSALQNVSKGRRIYLVLGERGTGKGRLFAQLFQAGESLRHSSNTEYHAQLYINLSFSSEIGSVFDAIIKFLDDPDMFKRAGPPPESSRLLALRRAVSKSDRPVRLLLAVSGIEALFNRGGAPKNAEIRDVLDILLGSGGGRSNVDLILFGRSSHVPVYFRKGSFVPDHGGCTTRERAVIPKELPITRGTSTRSRVFEIYLPSVSDYTVFQTSLLNAATEEARRRTDDIALLGGELGRYNRSIENAAGSRYAGEDLLERIFDFWYEVGRDPVLDENIVRHLAVIGMPVTQAVLEGCREIERAVNRKNSRSDRAIRGALESLASRNIIFKVRPRATAEGEANSAADRWTVHRAVQHHVYRRLGAQKTEPADTYYFAPSLYATQTSGFVQLNARAYAFIYELVDQLIAFPGRANLPLPRHPSAEELDRLQQCLRGALGVIRTLFSVGIVSRFDDLEGLPVPTPPQLGYFEHHRKAIRWMIALASSLEKRIRDTDKGIWAPFYRDEMVWLYNECAVFSLAQGEIYDADALFGMASKINRRIDGRQSASARRIRLNRSLCLLECGRLDDAEKRFAELADDEDEELLIRTIAHGYLGVVHNIKGRSDIAIRCYDRAIRVLVRMERYRPVSIFHRHKGDLLRHLNKLDAAGEQYSSAARAATSGGNVDLVHTAHVTIARLQVLRGRPDASVRGLLEPAMNYADAMELPRLKAEALAVQAERLLSGGETTLASQFAGHALRIATLHGLMLRKTAYMELLSRIYEQKGDALSAGVLRAKTLKAARGLGYTLLIDRVMTRESGATVPQSLTHGVKSV